MAMPSGHEFFDLALLLDLRRAIEELAPTAPPALRVVAGSRRAPRRLALLAGSFNPLTNAHLALADQALRSGRVDAVYFLLATRTVNKERIEGATLADRLICLRFVVVGRVDEGVVLVNRGLYVDQAEIARAAFPSVEELWFVVGYDKIEQIFDHRYYADYQQALDRLFRLASFLVTPRGAAGPGELARLLARPENRTYAKRVHLLDLPEVYRDESASRERARIEHGDEPGDVPPIVVSLVRETGAYAPPIERDGQVIDRYALRERLIDLVEDGALPMLPPDRFRDLFHRLLAPGERARRVREMVARGDGAAIVRELGKGLPS